MEKLLSEEVVTGQPLVCPLQLREERTQLFQLLCHKLPPASCRLLLFGLLSGRPLHVLHSEQRDAVRSCLGLVLPSQLAQPIHPSQAQAWATLSFRAAARPPTAGGDPGLLLLAGGECEASLACPTCICSGVSRLAAAATTCPACHAATSSMLVGRWMRIVRSEQLTLTARHMRMVTTVAEAVVQAKAWMRLKSPADRREFLKKLGFTKSDGEIFDMYNIFL